MGKYTKANEARVERIKKHLNEVASDLIDLDPHDVLTSALIDIKSRVGGALKRADDHLLSNLSRRALNAEKTLAHQDRKAAHGCTDAYCQICDRDE